MSKKCGYIALIGAPNSGKSTLLNALLRKKVSIVSNKPQTTRTRILGIVVRENAQMIFLDTPGLGKNAKPLAKSVWDACSDADVICYLIDMTRGWREDDTEALQKLSEAYKTKVFVLGTKTDKLKKTDLRLVETAFRAKFSELMLENAEFQMISAKKPEDFAAFLQTLGNNIPDSEWLYDAETVTDVSENFMCAEFVREQLFRQLGDEIPYQALVEIEHFERKPKIIDIHVIIKVARESQKAILIGSGGLRLKTIGQLARESLEKYLNQKVFLKIFVKKGEV